MSQLYTLFEHAAGYGLFRTTEFEEIAMLLPQVEASVLDLAKFRSIIQLVAFRPFKTASDALENINSISEGILHPSLQLFLETNMPKTKKKKQPVVLGVSDPKISSAITESLGITCQHHGVIPEIIRGIRLHFHNLVGGFKEDSASKAQLGLGHNYSRAKVKFNVNRVDNMIIQSICLLDQLDKDINTFAMRMREWYSYHFPELFKIVPENALYAKVVGIIKDRKSMPENVEELLEEVLMDSTKVQNVIDVSRSSMGMDLSPLDMINIQSFASRVVALAKYRKELMEYLKSKMHNIAPNLATLIGESVGARLISHAGSLTNLAKYPASTVQILGAEKALFRALKTRGNTPKYGLIFHSTFIGKAAKQNKGRISRYLANKCSIASRIDCFSEVPTEIFGQKLRQQVEDRLKFFETGNIPAKNVDVMAEAAEEVLLVQTDLIKKKKKKDKKEKKKKRELMNALADSTSGTIDDSLLNSTAGTIDNSLLNSTSEAIDNSHMDSSGGNLNGDVSFAADDQANVSRKSKKKRKAEEAMLNSSAMDVMQDEEDLENGLSPKKKKKKKNDASMNSEPMLDTTQEEESQPTKSKKKKKKKQQNEEFVGTTESDGVDDGTPIKKKKKKKLVSETLSERSFS